MTSRPVRPGAPETPIDLVRRQRDHAEAEVHRLRGMLNDPDLLGALVLAAKVLDAWSTMNEADRIFVRRYAPTLATALDALAAGPDNAAHRRYGRWAGHP